MHFLSHLFLFLSTTFMFYFTLFINPSIHLFYLSSLYNASNSSLVSSTVKTVLQSQRYEQLTETWLSAQGDEAKTAELAPSGFDVKSFPRQSRSRVCGIATVYKSTLGSSITFKTSFDFTHTSFEVVQASITLQHNTLHFFCLYRPPPNRRNKLLTLCLLNSCLTISIT